MRIHGREDLNRALLLRAASRFNRGDLEGFLSLFDRSVRVHGAPAGVRGALWIRDFFHDLLFALPDAQLDIDYVMATRGRLATRATLRGTHSRPFRGAPATGTRLEIGSAIILALGQAHVNEVWSEWPDLVARALAGDGLSIPVTLAPADGRRSSWAPL